jgi:hypothetical protein
VVCRRETSRGVACWQVYWSIAALSHPAPCMCYYPTQKHLLHCLNQPSLKHSSSLRLMAILIWVIVTYSPVGGHQRFGGTCHFHLPWKQSSGWLMYPDLEDVGSTFPSIDAIHGVTNPENKNKHSLVNGYRRFSGNYRLNLPWKIF